MGRIIQLEALCGLDLHGVVGPVLQGGEGAAIFVCGHRINQFIVNFPDFKGDVGNSFTGVDRVDFHNLYSADGGVVEGEPLSPTLLDENALGGAVQHKAVHRADLPRGDGSAGDQVGEDDLAVAVSDILAVTWAQGRPGAVGHQEGNALQRCCCPLDVLLNHQRDAGGVVKRQRLRVRRVDRHGLGLGSRVDGVAGNGLGLLDHDGAGDAGNADFPVLVGGVQPQAGQVAVGGIHIAAFGVGQLELHPGQGLLRHGIQLADDQRALDFVVKSQCLNLSRLDLNALRGAVQDIALQGLDLPSGHRDAGLQVRDDDAACLIGDVLPVAGAHHRAAGIGHQERDSL